MNGGHYLTKGHVILCLLYIKTILMSRNILEPEGNRFLEANSPLLQGRSAPSTLGGGHCKTICHARMPLSGIGFFKPLEPDSRSESLRE